MRRCGHGGQDLGQAGAEGEAGQGGAGGGRWGGCAIRTGCGGCRAGDESADGEEEGAGCQCDVGGEAGVKGQVEILLRRGRQVSPRVDFFGTLRASTSSNVGNHIPFHRR